MIYWDIFNASIIAIIIIVACLDKKKTNKFEITSGWIVALLVSLRLLLFHL